MSDLNLTVVLAKACDDLRKMKAFKGLHVIEAKAESESQKRADCESDERSPSWTESYIRDYVCCNFHLDISLDDCFMDPPVSKYVTVEFDYGQLERDFKAWLMPYFEGTEIEIPSGIDLQGGDTEFMKPGYGDDDE